MKITEDVCKYAAEQGIAEEEALKKGREEKSKEFGVHLDTVTTGVGTASSPRGFSSPRLGGDEPSPPQPARAWQQCQDAPQNLSKKESSFTRRRS